MSSIFWDTIKGHHLADVLCSSLPRLTENLSLLVQTNLTAQKPEKQFATYVDKQELQEYVKMNIDKGYNLVSIIEGNEKQDKVLVVLKF